MLKKNINSFVICLALIILNSNIYAEEYNVTKHDNIALKENTTIIDVYYGWPNVRYYADKSDSDNISANGVGPAGIHVERMLSDYISLGIDANCSRNYAKFNDRYHPDYPEENTIYKYRVIPEIGVHKYQSDKLDYYLNVGVGYYNYRKITKEYDAGKGDYVTKTKTSSFPVAARVAVGLRYFFTDHFGFKIEFGTPGGALLVGGLSCKF